MAAQIRDATQDDWPAIWLIVREVVVAADAFPYDPDLTEDEGRAMWMVASPGRTTVAVDGAEVAGVSWARAAGFRAMQFNAVAETNAAAVALYRSLGFSIVGTVPEAFDHPEHGLVGLHVMYLELGRRT